MPPARFAHRYIDGSISIDKLILFVFGLFGLGILLSFAVFYPNPTEFQFQIFIVVLALCAAGVGASLPGSMNVRIGNPIALKAGGALALFVLVLVYRPEIGQTVVRFTEPRTAAEPAAASFLAAFDQGDLSEAWKEMDPEARGYTTSSESEFEKIYTNFRKPLGPATRRLLIGTGSIQSPQGYPVGLYKSLNYRTRFSGAERCRAETIILRATQDLQWKPFMYLISPASIDCT